MLNRTHERTDPVMRRRVVRDGRRIVVPLAIHTESVGSYADVRRYHMEDGSS